MDVFHTHGAFSWIELTTPEPQQAARFYGELFGWRFDTQAPPEAGSYRVVQVDGSVRDRGFDLTDRLRPVAERVK